MREEGRGRTTRSSPSPADGSRCSCSFFFSSPHRRYVRHRDDRRYRPVRETNAVSSRVDDERRRRERVRSHAQHYARVIESQERLVRATTHGPERVVRRRTREHRRGTRLNTTSERIAPPTSDESSRTSRRTARSSPSRKTTNPTNIVAAFTVSLCHERVDAAYHLHDMPTGRYPPRTCGLHSKYDESRRTRGGSAPSDPRSPPKSWGV